MLWEHIIYASGFPTPDTNLNNPSDNRYAVISAVHDLIILTILIDGSTRILFSALYPSPVERVCRQHRCVRVTLKIRLRIQIRKTEYIRMLVYNHINIKLYT
jgi:hypothetical protein